MRTLATFLALAAASAFAAPEVDIVLRPFVPRSAPTNEVRVAVDVRPGNRMPLVECTVDGRPATMIFDTGASHTTLDVGFVARELPGHALQKVAMVGSTNVERQPSLVHAASLNVGEAGHNSLEIAVGQSDPRIVVQGGAVIQLPVRAQDDLLFRRTVQELFIEKRSGRDQIGTERKTGAHIVCHIGENVRIDHPFPVQERRSARCTLVGKKRRGTEHQHAQRRDQAEQKEQPDE